MGVAPGLLPDFLLIEGVDEFDLLGQDELSPRTLETVVEVNAGNRRAQLLASEADTMRLVEQSVRMGRHRFAGAVLANYHHSCAFCGFAPRSIPSNRLLVASHIKPWAVSDDRERLDPLNGVAACPTHDAAFDTGLITVNGGLRVHRAPPLAASSTTDPGVDRYFGEALNPTLLVPPGGLAPARPTSRGTTSTCTKARSLTLEGVLHDVHSGIKVYMLPDAHDPPSPQGERPIYPPVALHVACELRHPVLPVALGDALVLRTAMPEASVEEDCHAPLRENDVGAHTGAGYPQHEVLPIPVATSMQR